MAVIILRHYAMYVEPCEDDLGVGIKEIREGDVWQVDSCYVLATCSKPGSTQALEPDYLMTGPPVVT
jgi:hypothetical protein